MKITIETTVAAPVADVWRAWTTPEDIRQWNAASDDWHTTASTVDLRVGGTFSAHMAARDGSVAFDFTGTFTEIVPHERLVYVLGDGRPVTVEFAGVGDGRTRVRETFESEGGHSADEQRAGWQAILDRFARHVEARR